jgi:hypothetical protein
LPLSGLAGNNPVSCREKNTPTIEYNYVLKSLGSPQFLMGTSYHQILQTSEGPLTMMKQIGFAKVKSEFNFLNEYVGRRFRATGLESFFNA